ncbi:MAG: hypothetical protein OXH04_20635 [Acidobacteria bacterium]|nr:hypothetical protein [Acidobacteriota bacterium]
MTEPLEPEVAPTTMICAIPTAPASADNVSLQQIYDNQAQYLGTVRHPPSHTELAQMAVLHGFRPASPVSAIQWTNQYAQRVILLVASHATPQFRNCDHGRSAVLGRRPFRGPLRAPAVTAAHRHYPALPVSAIQWTNPYAQRVILIVASRAEPQFHNCDHGRSLILGRRPFRGPLRAPAVAAAHQHYTELRRCRHCNGVQMVNVGATGAREASPWFEPDDGCMTWSGLYAAALAAGAPGTTESA